MLNLIAALAAGRAGEDEAQAPGPGRRRDDQRRPAAEAPAARANKNQFFQEGPNPVGRPCRSRRFRRDGRWCRRSRRVPRGCLARAASRRPCANSPGGNSRSVLAGRNTHLCLDALGILVHVVERVGPRHPHEMPGVVRRRRARGRTWSARPRWRTGWIIESPRVLAFLRPLVAVQLLGPARNAPSVRRNRPSVPAPGLRSGLGAAVVVAAFPVRIELDRHRPESSIPSVYGWIAEPRPNDVDHALDRAADTPRPIPSPGSATARRRRRTRLQFLDS